MWTAFYDYRRDSNVNAAAPPPDYAASFTRCQSLLRAAYQAAAVGAFPQARVFALQAESDCAEFRRCLEVEQGKS